MSIVFETEMRKRIDKSSGKMIQLLRQLKYHVFADLKPMKENQSTIVLLTENIY